MSNIPKPNEIYKHFKGNLYKIITLATDSETGAEVVVYQALYGDFKVYVRELDMFMSKVDKNKYPLVTQENRFELQGAVIGQQTDILQQEKDVQQKKDVQQTEAPQQIEDAEQSETVQPVQEPEEEAEPALDPMLIEFLEANTYEAKLNILVGLHHRITDAMINTMAASLDVEVNEGDIERRYDDLKACLSTFEKYECNRMR